jgi:ATP-dependent DNA ligase
VRAVGSVNSLKPCFPEGTLPGASAATPAFGLLYHRGCCLLHEPLARRREDLAELTERQRLTERIYSAGVVGCGTAFYATVLAQGHEGVVAKHLASTYRPGRRTPAWRKIKPPRRAHRP